MDAGPLHEAGGNDHTVSRTGIFRLGGRGPIDEFSLGIDGKWHRVARPAAPWKRCPIRVRLGACSCPVRTNISYCSRPNAGGGGPRVSDGEDHDATGEPIGGRRLAGVLRRPRGGPSVGPWQARAPALRPGVVRRSLHRVESHLVGPQQAPDERSGVLEQPRADRAPRPARGDPSVVRPRDGPARRAGACADRSAAAGRLPPGERISRRAVGSRRGRPDRPRSHPPVPLGGSRQRSIRAAGLALGGDRRAPGLRRCVQPRRPQAGLARALPRCCDAPGPGPGHRPGGPSVVADRPAQRPGPLPDLLRHDGGRRRHCCRPLVPTATARARRVATHRPTDRMFVTRRPPGRRSRRSALARGRRGPTTRTRRRPRCLRSGAGGGWPCR